MAKGPLGAAARRSRTVPTPDPSGDRRLLRRFVASGDGAAFADLVQRHGPLVLSLCRRLLQDAHDAEDAFQATFLVLAQQAAAIRRPDSLASWLYGVAYRLAGKMRAQAARRRQLERRIADRPAANLAAELTWRELCAALDEELARLPDHLRTPLLLCYTEGKTQDEAARQLGWPRGTFKRRLERARELVRGRLCRRGLALSAVLTAALLADPAAGAAVPAALVERTVRAAAAWVQTAGLAAGGVDGAVGRVLGALLVTKLLVLFAFTLAVSLFPVGPGALPLPAWARRPPDPRPDSPNRQEPLQEEANPEAEPSEYSAGSYYYDRLLNQGMA
jgi:RNA polymerase sigma factor (sigma-70 family)